MKENDLFRSPAMNDLVRLPQIFEDQPNWKKAAVSGGAALLLVALGWGGGAKIDSLRGPSPEQIEAKVAAKAAAKAAQDVAALHAQVDSLKGRLDGQAEQAREAEAAVASLQKSLAEEKARSQGLNARIEKMQTLATANPAPSHALPVPSQAHALPVPPQAQSVDRAPTASIPQTAKPALAAVAPKPPAAAQAAPKPLAPKAYRAYVLREVSDGLAVVEGVDGVEEVAPGDVLPGGARVQRIEKRGGGWVVLTDRGYIGSDDRWEN
jgi:hypothetical protein